MPYPFPPPVGSSSPWGQIQTVTPLGPDAAFVTTASHGGLRISAAGVARMPEPLQRTAYSGDGWFEEDCDWALPYLALGLQAFEQDPARAATICDAAACVVRGFHPLHADLLGVLSQGGLTNV